MPPDLGAAAFARAHGFRYVEEQHNADCLKHALNNLLFSTDRLPDDAFDGKRGLTLVVARLVSQERDYWDFDMIKWFAAATFGDHLHVDAQYFHPDAFGAEEFVERLKRPDSVGAVLQVRCMDLRRPDHYVALVPREIGFDIIDSIPHTPDRVLVRGRDTEVAGDDQSGFVVTKLHGRPLERNFLASWGEGMLCCIRMEPLSPLLRAEEVLPTLRFLHGRQVCGVAFITAAHTATAAEPSQVVSASPPSAPEVDILIEELIRSGDVRVEDTSNDVLKESGLSLEPSHPAACVPEDASHAVQQIDSDVPPVKATPKKLVIKGATKQSRTWVVDKDTGRPTCFRNNYKEWTWRCVQRPPRGRLHRECIALYVAPTEACTANLAPPKGD